jgi:hypothetical protein
MGAAASTTAARSQVTDLLNDKNGQPKPADASDITVRINSYHPNRTGILIKSIFLLLPSPLLIPT